MIGAGLSGLAAAKKLHDSGISVVVLESSEIIGGRVRGILGKNYYFDQGSSWLHAYNGVVNPLKELSLEVDLRTSRFDYDDIVLYDKGGAKISQESFAQKFEIFGEVYSSIQTCGQEGQSFYEIYCQKFKETVGDQFMEFFLANHLEFNNGDREHLSATTLERYETEE